MAGKSDRDLPKAGQVETGERRELGSFAPSFCSVGSAAGSNERGVPLFVEPRAHFPAGLEERRELFDDRHLVARVGIATRARPTPPGREGAEAAQLHAIAARQRAGDLAEDGVGDILDVVPIEVRISFRQSLNQFRLSHYAAPLRTVTRFLLAVGGRY